MIRLVRMAGMIGGLCLLAWPSHASRLIRPSSTLASSPLARGSLHPMTKIIGPHATDVPQPAAELLKLIAKPSLTPALRITAPARRQQILCLALVMYQEARGQSAAERTAVAQVVFNRSAQNGASLCAVIWADHGSQFQWVKRGMAAILPQETEVWQTIQTEALHLYAKRPADTTRGATHFFNPELCRPSWALSGTVTAHFTQVFLRLRQPKPLAKPSAPAFSANDE